MVPLQILSKRTGGFRNYFWIAGFILSFSFLTMPAAAIQGTVSPGICLPDYYGDTRCCTDLETTLQCIQYSCLNGCDYNKCWSDDPTPPPTTCTSGRIANSSTRAVFYALLGHVRINNPQGREIVNSLVVGKRLLFSACPAGEGVYTVHMDLLFYDCYTCTNTTLIPTTEPTQNVTPTVTPTHPEVVFTFPTPSDPNSVPVTDFTADVTNGPAQLTIHFTDLSTNSPTQWMWLFGDGTSSTLRNPAHAYTSPGNYTVSLTAANTYGADTERKRNYVGVTPGPKRYTFAVTNTKGEWNETYQTWTWDDNARNDIAYMSTYLTTSSNWNNVQWTQKFAEDYPDVTKDHFSVSSSGENTLNSATLYYHSGHGYSNADGTNSYLVLRGEERPPVITLTPSDVAGKWGGKNKWVILQSCLVLRDEQWQNVFTSVNATHGILGYKTESYPHKDFMKRFFEYAKAYSVRESFFRTVQDLDYKTYVDKPGGGKERLTAVTVFSSPELADNDYLPGFGSGIQADADPVQPVRSQWPPTYEGGV